MKLDKGFFSENIKTLFYALVIAVVIRSLFIQPFYIPSSSMEPTLHVGERLFVTKYSYGYSKHSFPFSPPILNKRVFFNSPERGDVIVFKTPADNRTDYIKRLIGLSGDSIQFINGELFINTKKINRVKIEKKNLIRCGNFNLETNTFIETLPNGVKHLVSYKKKGSLQNTKKFKVPSNHYFLLGDNRDCSKDSRYLTSVGYVHEDNLVGKAQFIFFSSDKRLGNIFSFWKWNKSLRFNRFFKKII